MCEFIAGTFALGVAAQVGFWTVVGVLFPAFWLWMLLDAAFRPNEAYSGGSTEKIVWIVVMAFFQIASLVYFAAVYRLGTSPRVAEVRTAA